MAKGTTSKASGGGVGNALRDLGRSITGSGGGDVRRAEDKAANQPSYSAMSLKGLTSSDPANVARNQAAAKMYADMPASVSRDRPEAPEAPAAAAAPAAPAVTPMPVLPAPTLTPPAAPLPVVPVQPPTPGSAVEGPAAALIPVSSGAGTTSAAGGQAEAALIASAATGEAEKKVAETATQGRRSTILTSALGLLADAEATGQLRKRRSLMGGGLIQ